MSVDGRLNPGEPDRVFTTGQFLARPLAPGSAPDPATEPPGPPGPEPPDDASGPPVAEAPTSHLNAEAVAAEPPLPRRGPPRDEIALDRAPRPGDSLLECPACALLLNGRVPDDLFGPLTHGSHFDCPGCSTGLRLDLVSDDQGVGWHLAQRPEPRRSSLRPAEHRVAAAATHGWLCDPQREPYQAFSERFSREHPDLRPWEVLFGVYDIRVAGPEQLIWQRRVEPVQVPLQRYRAQQRRAVDLPVRPVNGVYPRADVLAALMPPAAGLTCGDCGRPLRTEQTDGVFRMTCPSRRHRAPACLMRSTRRAERVQQAVKQAVERLLSGEGLLHGLYPAWLEALHLGLPELSLRGLLPPLCPLNEPTDDELDVMDEWDDPDATEENVRLFEQWHQGYLPRPEGPHLHEHYAARWLTQVRAINELDLEEEEKASQRRALERAQGSAILEARAQRLPCRREFLWAAHCQGQRLAQCRIPPEELADMVEQVVISEVRRPGGEGRVWQAEVRLRRSALIRLVLPAGQHWPLPDGTETITVSVDGRSPAEEQADNVRVLSTAGRNQDEIAELLDLSQSTVSRILQSPAPERTPDSGEQGVPDSNPLGPVQLLLVHLTRPSIQLKWEAWNRQSDIHRRKHLKRAVQRFCGDDDTYPELRPWSLSRQLRAGDERDVDGDQYGHLHGRSVPRVPGNLRIREQRPHLTIGLDVQLVCEITGMLPLLYERDPSWQPQYPSADYGWQAAQALAFDGDGRWLGQGARQQTIRAAAQEIQAIDRGEIAPGSPLLIALAVWSDDNFERTLIEAMAAAGFESQRIADSLGYPAEVIDYVRHLFDPGPPGLDRRRYLRDGDDAAAVQRTVRSFLLAVAAIDPGRLMRLLAAWAELGLIPRNCRFEQPDPLLSEGELLTADVLFQAEFMSPTEENVRFVADSLRTIERIQRKRVRAADSRTAPEDEQERKLGEAVKVMIPGLVDVLPELRNDPKYADYFQDGPGSPPASRTGPAVDRFWRPIPAGADSPPAASLSAATDKQPVTSVNKNSPEFAAPPAAAEANSQSVRPISADSGRQMPHSTGSG